MRDTEVQGRGSVFVFCRGNTCCINTTITACAGGQTLQKAWVVFRQFGVNVYESSWSLEAGSAAMGRADVPEMLPRECSRKGAWYLCLAQKENKRVVSLSSGTSLEISANHAGDQQYESLTDRAA